MFIETSAPVPLPIDDARSALDGSLADDRLLAASQRGFETGLAALRCVGPRGKHAPNKSVVVRSLPSRECDGVTIVSIRWEAVGVTGRLFPVLDADLCLNRVNEVTSLLSLIGRYSPPFGAMGELIDRAVLSGAAQASVDSFVREVSASLRDITTARRADAAAGHR